MAKKKEEEYQTLRRAVVHSVEARSVIRLAGACHLCLSLVWIITMSVFWFVFHATGVWDKFNSLLADLAGIDPLTAGPYFLFVFSIAILEFSVFTLLAGLGAIVFNILSHRIGGVRLILADSVIFSHDSRGEKAAALSAAAEAVSVRKGLRDEELADQEERASLVQTPVVRPEPPRISITVDSAQGNSVRTPAVDLSSEQEGEQVSEPDDSFGSVIPSDIPSASEEENASFAQDSATDSVEEKSSDQSVVKEEEKKETVE